MLKKAGIVVATAALSMLAVSPLAFAGDKSDHDGGKDDKSHAKVVKHDEDHDDEKHDDDGKHEDKKHEDKKHEDKKEPEKKAPEKKVEEGNLSNDCEFANQGGDVSQSQVGGSGLLGVVDVITGAATNATSQLDTLNCTNVNVTDVIDVDSGNTTSTEETTAVEDSFNS